MTNLIIPAFIAGILMFLAPCTFPLVPGYLAFIGGVSLEDLKDPKKARKARIKIIINGILFVVGLSLTFILMGTLVAFVGSRLLGDYRLWLSRAAGIFIIVFALFMMGLIKIPTLYREKKIKPPKFLKAGEPATSLFMGFAFGFGWTPCAGPVVAAILSLAGSSQTVAQGASLLAIFSLGLGIPFLIVAIAIGSAGRYINKISRYLKVISFIGGIFLIALGLLLLFNKMILLLSLSYRFFELPGLDRIFERL